MANTRSAIKRIRSSARKRERNRVFRSRVRTLVNRTRKLIDEGKVDEAKEQAQVTVVALDKAAQKGIIHKNKAARHKSRLMKRINKLV